MPVTHHLRESVLPRLSLRRPVTVIVIFVALLVLGVIAFRRIGLELMPGGMENRWLGVYVPYPNATPAEVEQQIARPLEGVLRTLSGVENIFTNSGRDGCDAGIEFNQDTDMAEAYNELRDRADRILAELPRDVRRVNVRKWNNDDIPVLGIDFPVTGSYADLHTIVEEQIRRPLERLDGVANVGIWGANARRVEIDLVHERINAHGVDVARLLRQLERDNFAMASGWITDGAHKLYVRSDSRYQSLAQIAALPVEGHPGLALGDIAEVAYRPPETNHFFRLNGKPGVGIWVLKESEANAVDVARRILATLKDDVLTRPQMAGFETHVYFDQADMILTSLAQLKSSGLWGGVFAILILFFFLRRIGMTLVIAGAIPLSVMCALIAMYFMGWTLNLLTMLGLIIGVGMVVDNSIVVTEAIYARRLAGEDPFRAALHGASEVGLAITVSTLTTVAVFFPLIFMSGNKMLAFQMARLGMPVVWAIAASLLVALLFIPLLMSRLMRAKPPTEPRSIVKATEVYRRMLSWTTAHRLETALIALVLFVTIAIPAKKVPAGGGGGEGHGFSSIYVSFDMPDYYAPAESDSVMRSYEAFVDSNRARYAIDYVQTDFWRGGGSIWAFVRPDRRQWYTIAWHRFRERIGQPVERPLTQEEAYDHFRKNAPRFAGVKTNIDRQAMQAQGGQRTSVTLFGDDTETLLRLAREVERRLRLLPEVTEVQTDVDEGSDELHIRVNRDRAQQYGIDGRVVGETIGSAVRGATLAKFHTAEREVDVVVRLRETDRKTLDQVMNLVVSGSDGARARIGSLVDVTVAKDLQSIRRENGRTRVRVSAMSPEKDVAKFSERITHALQGFVMPPGYQWSLTGQFEEIRELNKELQFAVLMSVALVFLLMGILFESFILPLSVIMSIPLSFLGVFWFLYLAGEAFDVMAWIGAIILIGVVVNNAIVLVDLINRLRADGLERVEAIVEAGRQRFRPILMTSGTTICGLIPMALGDPRLAGMPYSSLGIAMIGGLTTSTLLTLLVVPLFYTLFDDLRIFMANLVALIRHRKAEELAG